MILTSVYSRQFPAAAFIANGNHKTPLHYAAREGKTDIIEYFLRVVPTAASVASDKDKLPLHFAAGEGHYEIVQALLRVHPAGASMPTAKGKLPLHFAARWNHLQVCQLLLSVFPDAVRALDWDQSLPLHDAAREGQYEVSRLLVELYPHGLMTSNLRCDIPLFLAVRSANLRLIALFVQVWPHGSRVVLNNSTSYEKVHTWSNQVIELLLRGAVDQLESCEWMRPLWVPNLPQLTEENCEPQSSRPPKRAKYTFSSAKEGTRTKSPILDRSDGPEAPVSDPSPHIGRLTAPVARSTAFLPLHAGLTVGASCQVLSTVMDHWPASIEQVDEFGRTPLHLAVTRCSSMEGARWVLDDLLVKFPGAAFQRDHLHRLPLHVALASRAHPSVIVALVDLDPDVCSAKCESRDVWCHMTPIHMACACDCELETVYELVRRDPSFFRKARAGNRE